MQLVVSAAQNLLLLFLIVNVVLGQQYKGERCRFGRSRQRGRCVVLRRCQYAIEQVQQNIYPQLCGFEGIEPIVCCPRSAEVINRPSVPSPVGTKSRQKCQEFTSIQVKDKIQIVTAVVGGVQARPKEFPHMAALGFGEENNVQWQCGGTLISETFVLTAAHCLYSQEFGDVKYVRLGVLNLKSVQEGGEPQDFRVIATYRNPDYKPPSQYNDIGLIRLDHPAQITVFVKPACLYTERNLPQSSVPVALGWGRLSFAGDTSDHLMKVALGYFTNEQCRQVYTNVPQRRLPNGIDDNTQLCAGGINESKDTCQGDSGGPLQISDANNAKQFIIIGVTSFGKGCGVENIPGVYTRVSNYIPWIEGIVWPDS